MKNSHGITMGFFIGFFRAVAHILGGIFMKHKQIMTTKRLVINAVLISIYVVLRFFNLSFGEAFRFTLASFPVILCALLFGPVDGFLVGLLGEFLSQVLGPYGLTPTTLLWCIGESVRGGTLGLCALLFLRKWLLAGEKLSGMRFTVMLICCIATGVLAALGQTFALYVDSTMMGYYKYEIVFGVMAWRILVYVILSGLFCCLSIPVISALRKAKFV